MSQLVLEQTNCVETTITVKDSSGKPVKAEILLNQYPKVRPTEAPFGDMFYGLMTADLQRIACPDSLIVFLIEL